MERRRIDLALGLAASVVLHGAALTAASGILSSRNTAPPAADPRPPLEVLVVEEHDWLAQLEESQPIRTAQLLEAPSVHRTPELPEWPELEIARPREQAVVLRVPVTRQSIDSLPPVAEQRRELVEPPPLLEDLREPLPDASVTEATAPVPIENKSSLVLYRPELRYPARPLRRGIEGIARVGIEVDSTGRVARTWLLKSSGNRELDRAGLENLRRWRFDAAAVEAAGLGRSFRNDVRFVIE